MRDAHRQMISWTSDDSLLSISNLDSNKNVSDFIDFALRRKETLNEDLISFNDALLAEERLWNGVIDDFAKQNPRVSFDLPAKWNLCRRFSAELTVKGDHLQVVSITYTEGSDYSLLPFLSDNTRIYLLNLSVTEYFKLSSSLEPETKFYSSVPDAFLTLNNYERVFLVKIASKGCHFKIQVDAGCRVIFCEPYSCDTSSGTTGFCLSVQEATEFAKFTPSLLSLTKLGDLLLHSPQVVHHPSLGQEVAAKKQSVEPNVERQKPLIGVQSLARLLTVTRLSLVIRPKK